MNQTLSNRLVDALLDDSVDIYEVWAEQCDIATEKDVRIIQEMYKETAFYMGYDSDDDFELILESVMANIVETYMEV